MNHALSEKDINTLIGLCSLNKEESCSLSNIDDKLANVAVSNGVGAWCYHKMQNGLIDGVSQSVGAKWKQIYFHNTIVYQKYWSVFQRVQEQLLKAGIPVIALKGIALSSGLYKDEGLRPMGDIDLLVPEGRGMDALRVVLEMGAKPLAVPRSEWHEQSDAHLRPVKIDGIMVELHQRLFSLGSAYYTKNVDFFKHKQTIEKQGLKLQILNDRMMGYHLVAHAIKGIEMGGLRFGWLLDIALLISKQEDQHVFINEIIAVKPSQAKKMRKLIDMALLLLSSSVKSTYSSGLQMEITQLMEEKDLKAKHRIINLVQLCKVPGLRMKIALLWREFFPQKEYMQFRYGAIKGSSVWKLYLKRIIRK